MKTPKVLKRPHNNDYQPCCFPVADSRRLIFRGQMSQQICAKRTAYRILLNATPNSDWPDATTPIWIDVPMCDKHAEELTRIRRGEKI